MSTRPIAIRSGATPSLSAVLSAQYYGGQTGGECTTFLAAASGTGGTKWYADYGTAWAMAGCKSETLYPIYASTFYDTQLACCKAAYAGQSNGACIKGLANPPTSSPTKAGDFGTDWNADYPTSWATSGCKNTLPRPNYAIQLYKTELECCKAAYGGQTSEACVRGLLNPPTKSPSKSPTQKPTSLTSTCSVLVTTYDASNIDSMFLTGLMWK